MNNGTHALGREVVFRADKDTTEIGKIVGVTQQFDAEGKPATTYQLRCNGAMPIDVPADHIVGHVIDLPHEIATVMDAIARDPFDEVPALRHLIEVLSKADAERAITRNAAEVKGALCVLFAALVKNRLGFANQEVSVATILNDPKAGGDLDDEIPF